MWGSVVDTLNIEKNIIPCIWVFRIVHVQDMHDHLVDDLSLAIHLGLESSGFGEIGVQQ